MSVSTFGEDVAIAVTVFMRWADDCLAGDYFLPRRIATEVFFAIPKISEDL